MDIYNALGQKVKTLINRKHLAGKYFSIWDGTNDNGEKMASGTYFYEIETGDFVQAKKMIFVK